MVAMLGVEGTRAIAPGLDSGFGKSSAGIPT